MAKRDDVCHVGDLHLVECFGGISALPCHDLAPVGLEMVKDTLDGVVGIPEPKVLFIELFNVLFFNAVNNWLDVNDRDRLLKIKLPEEFLRFFLKHEDFEGGRCCNDLFVDSVGLSNRCGGNDIALCDRGIISVVKDKCEGSMETAPHRGFDRGNHLGHLFHHDIHGVRGWLADNDVKGFCSHDEGYRLMNGQARGQGVVHCSDENLELRLLSIA